MRGIRTLIAAASDREGIASLARIIGDNDLKAVATQARKAIAEIDYVLYGPQAIKEANAKCERLAPLVDAGLP